MIHRTPLVSVVTPCLNGSKYIAETIASVRGQTITDFEHIVVDDGSRDDSALVVARAYQGDPRLRYQRHARTEGLGAARTTGMRLARGAFIAFVDSDDLWDERFLQRSLEALQDEGPACCAVFCWSQCMDAAGVLNGHLLQAPAKRYGLSEFMQAICPPGNGSSLLLRRESLMRERAFRDWPQGTDAEMWLRMLSRARDRYFACLPELLVSYRSHPLSMTSRIDSGIRAASLQARLRRYLRFVDPSQRWLVYAAFARRADAVGVPAIARRWQQASQKARRGVMLG